VVSASLGAESNTVNPPEIGERAKLEPTLMAVLLTPLSGSADVWRHAFAAAMPELELRIWPEVENPAEITVAVLGAPPAGALRKLPNLRLIVSLTAGTDALLRDPDLPNVPIVRAGDPAGDAMINEML
jgi:hypothetical protein